MVFHCSVVDLPVREIRRLLREQPHGHRTDSAKLTPCPSVKLKLKHLRRLLYAEPRGNG